MSQSNFLKHNLRTKGYVYLSEIATESEIDSILQQLGLARSNSLPNPPLNLNDSKDAINTIYSSDRSPIEYCYLKSPKTFASTKSIKSKLKSEINLDWDGNINSKALPVFVYTDKSYIKKHRDRDIGFGENVYIAVLMLTRPTEDYNEGYFYINERADSTTDGKIVFFEDKRYRKYFQINKGDVLIFDNLRFIHGTTPVKETDYGKKSRITASLRGKF